MDSIKLSPAELISELKQAGKQPDHSLIEAIISSKQEITPLLLTRFRDILSKNDLNKLTIDNPERHEGILICRLCIEMGLMQALPILGELLRQSWGDDVTVDGLGREPAHFGPDGIPLFASLLALNTLNKWHNGKSAAITILTDIALSHPKAALQIREALRSGLPKLNSNGGISEPKDEMWGDIAIALGKLQDEPSQKQILAMIRQGVTDSGVITRDRYEQFLSGKKSPRQPVPFDIYKIYASSESFDQMMQNMLGGTTSETPDHSHDLVARAKRIEAMNKRAKGSIGRNDPCSCGSGKKYKNCCGKNS